MPGPLGELRVVTLNQGSKNCPKSGQKLMRKTHTLAETSQNLTIFLSSEMREKSWKLIQPRAICSARQFSSLSPVRYLRNPSLFPNRNIESGHQPKAFAENPSPSFKPVTLRKSGVFVAFLLGNLTQENQRVPSMLSTSYP